MKYSAFGIVLFFAPASSIIPLYRETSVTFIPKLFRTLLSIYYMDSESQNHSRMHYHD